MKSVLISIQPKWCAKIASGAKTIEVRKTAPKIATPFKCYIYCTKGNPNDPHQRLETHATNGKINLANGTVFAEFICDRISIFRPKSLTCESAVKKASCLTVQGLIDYAGSKDHVFGWHITDLVIYDQPKPLGDFLRCTYPWDCGFCYQYDDAEMVCKKKLIPPQSWCYVERGTDNA